MSTYITRAGKGSALTHTELDTRAKQASQTKAAAYTVAESDNRDTIEYSGAGTEAFTLPDAATVVAAADTGDFEVTVKHVGTGTLTVDRTTGADTIDGAAADITLQPNESKTLKVNQAGDGYVSIAYSHGGTIVADLTGDILDDNGLDIITRVTTASAANNVRVTNAATGNSAKIDCTETNSDLDFPRNGTGEITVDSTPIYGLVILDTPILLATNTATTSTAKADIDLTTHTTGVATKSIIRIATSIVATAGLVMTVRIGEQGETFSSLHDAIVVSSSLNSSATRQINTVHTNLATGEIFSWQLIVSGALTTHTTTLHLIGYYV